MTNIDIARTAILAARTFMEDDYDNSEDACNIAWDAAMEAGASRYFDDPTRLANASQSDVLDHLGWALDQIEAAKAIVDARKAAK